MMNDGMPTRILRAMAKLTGNEDTSKFSICLFSDGSGVVLFSDRVDAKPDWCMSLMSGTNSLYRVFSFDHWRLEDGFVMWYEQHFESTSKEAKLVAILNFLRV